MAQQASTAKASPKSPRAVVEAFFDACRALDFERGLALIADDCVYKNVPFHSARGKERIVSDLGVMGKAISEFEVEMIHIAVDGQTVLTERIDTLGGRFFRVSIPLMGAFVVDDDARISEWRDYFDWSAVAGKMGRSALVKPFKR